VSLTLAAAAHAEGPPCLASVEVAPSRAVVGQQVTYMARVLRRPDVGTVSWVQGLSFPSFRAEWLPGLSAHTRLRKQATSYLVYEERRALFPMRPGRLEIPAASLSCALYAPAGGERRTIALEVPASAIEVDEPPQSGRPHSWSGLVGRVEVKLTAEPSTVALGDTVRVTVTLAGDGNLWAAAAPFGQAPFERSDGAEVFARTPELAFDPGEQLHLRRVFAFELVPRQSGRLRIPSYELSFFDPTLQRFEVSKTEPLVIPVVAQEREGLHAFGSDREPSEAARAPVSVEPGEGTVSPFMLGGLVLAVASGAALALRRRRARARAPDRVSDALRAADRARQSGDADAERHALARALRAGLEHAVLGPAESSGARPAVGALSANELAERSQGDPTLATAAEILLAEEHARFARSREFPATERLRAAALRLSRHRRARGTATEEPSRERCGPP
jgi:hypothetical protein